MSDGRASPVNHCISNTASAPRPLGRIRLSGDISIIYFLFLFLFLFQVWEVLEVLEVPWFEAFERPTLRLSRPARGLDVLEGQLRRIRRQSWRNTNHGAELNPNRPADSGRLVARIELENRRIPRAITLKVIELSDGRLATFEIAARLGLPPALVTLILRGAPQGAKP